MPLPLVRFTWSPGGRAAPAPKSEAPAQNIFFCYILRETVPPTRAPHRMGMRCNVERARGLCVSCIVLFAISLAGEKTANRGSSASAEHAAPPRISHSYQNRAACPCISNVSSLIFPHHVTVSSASAHLRVAFRYLVFLCACVADSFLWQKRTLMTVW